MKQRLVTIGIVAILCAGAVGLVRLDFMLWKTIHPQAPTWAYFLDNR